MSWLPFKNISFMSPQPQLKIEVSLKISQNDMFTNLKLRLKLWSLAWHPSLLSIHHHPLHLLTKTHKHVLFTWFDTFCRHVNKVCSLVNIACSLWRVHMWRYLGFAESALVRVYIQTSLLLSSGKKSTWFWWIHSISQVTDDFFCIKTYQDLSLNLTKCCQCRTLYNRLVQRKIA